MRVTMLKDKAQAARSKSPAYGQDIDPSSYRSEAEDRAAIDNLSALPNDEAARAEEVGMDPHDACRAGTYMQVDHSVLMATARQSGLEVMDIAEALAAHPWLSELWWNAVAVDSDKYTAEAELCPHHGYFIRALPGAKVALPVQACMMMSSDGLLQNVHNIVIAEEGSELHIITGCASGHAVSGGLHIGISEFYIRRGARLSFTMVHSWSREMAVRPRSGAIVEEDGLFMSNYICMQPVGTLQMYPTVRCAGPRATARMSSVLVAREGSIMDIGGRAILSARGSRAEIVSRAITRGGEIIARGHLVGEVPGIRAHLECRGLILSDKGCIRAIPELEGRAPDVEMSHEAAVGKIARDEIEYLMSRGATEEEATSAIVRGFLDIEIKGLPPALAEAIRQSIAEEGGRGM